MSERHDLAHEFPEMKAAIHSLKLGNKHFQRLFDKYESVSKELHRAGDGAVLSDEHAEELKKQRLALKDELYSLLKKEASADCSSCSCSCDG